MSIIDDNSSHVDFSNLINKSILVVDDNSINQMINYDAILMDIHMPKMDGYEATENIRKFNAKIPILALTAVQINGNKERIINSGINGIIVKPFVLENFFNELNKFIKTNKEPHS